MLALRAVFVAGAAVAMCVGAWAAPQDAHAGKAVVELFTSQGCSSCPPADRLVARLAAKGDVIALTFPVTLWDYLGWTDTLATRENTERQFAYAQTRGDSAVYTPQIMINGREDVVGNDERAVLHEIAEQKARNEAPSVPVSLSRNGSVIEVRVGARPDDVRQNATIWLGHVTPEVTVDISRGENTGRKIVYHNVVRSLRAIGMWKGERVAIDLPMSEFSRHGETAGVVLVQIDTPAGPGPIVGADMITWQAPAASARAAN